MQAAHLGEGPGKQEGDPHGATAGQGLEPVTAAITQGSIRGDPEESSSMHLGTAHQKERRLAIYPKTDPAG